MFDHRSKLRQSLEVPDDKRVERQLLLQMHALYPARKETSNNSKKVVTNVASKTSAVAHTSSNQCSFISLQTAVLSFMVPRSKAKNLPW